MAKSNKNKNNKNKTKGAIRFVMMIGDEGAILIQMQNKKVTRRLFAQSPDEAHTRAFNEALLTAPNAPIMLLIDMMDQSYVRQTLPPVSALSVGKIVKRRLDKDFSPDDIKGYLILDREKTGRKDWNYLMVSLANTQILQRWINFVVERNNPFGGIGLLPLETQSLLTAIEKILHPERAKDESALEWQILVSHHKVGGFRQVVLRKGRLVFTRMAQPIGESHPDVIAGNIEQEIINTLEYLKRLGLQDTSALSVAIIASDEIKQALDPKNIKSGEYRFFTPHELADLLGIPDAAQPEDHFGDVVSAAFIARRRKLLLSLSTPLTRKLKKLSLYLLGLRGVAALALLGIIGWAGMSGYDIFSTHQQIGELESRLTTEQSALDSLKTKAKTLPKELDKFTDVVNLSKIFNKRTFDSLFFVNKFATSLGNAALAVNYHWGLSTPETVTKDADKRQLEADIDLRLIAPQEPHDAFIASAQALMDRIRQAFPDYDVGHSELPGIISDTKEIRTTLDDTSASTSVTATKIDTVKITIKGPLPADKVTKNGK